MLTFDENQVRKILLEELGYPEDRIERTLPIISNRHELLQPILDQWLEDRTVSNQKINGVPMELVYKYFKVEDFIDGLIYMNMFAKNEHLANKFLKNPYKVVAKR